MTESDPTTPTPPRAAPTEPPRQIDPRTLAVGRPNLKAEQPSTPAGSEPLPAETPIERGAGETGKTGSSGIRVPPPVLPVFPAPAVALVKSRHRVSDDVFTPAPDFNPVVEALIAHGLYLGRSEDGEHRLTCPWASEHPAGAEPEASYLEPSAHDPTGRFLCAHLHSEKRDAQSLIDHLGIPQDVARAKAVVRIIPGEAYRAVAASERVLAADGRYFNATGPIVRIVMRDGKGISSELVNDHTLSTELASKIDFYKQVRGKGWERTDPPSSLIQSLKYGQDRLYLPQLEGLARQPFYGADGRLISTPGFDKATGIYGAFDGEEYDLQGVSQDQAEHELQYFKWLLREFQFASDADRSAAISAILTAAVRPSLLQAPAFNINAARSGGGKSYLASLIALAASPDEPYSVSYPTTADEATKVILAMLLEKPAVVLFDDMQIQTGWKSLGPINKALTSPTTTERLLGQSRTATARTNVLFLGTGNNVEPGQDMRRRVVSIRLAPKGESPALRSFAFTPVAHIRKNRSHIVRAALTMIEAYRAAGSPVYDVPSIGSYEEWSMFCRQPLIWLGEPDPATSLIRQVEDDTDQATLGALLTVWFKLFDDEAMMIREVIPEAARSREFMDVLEEIGVMDGRDVNTRRFGWYLRNNLGRWANGLQIASGPNSQRTTWRVIRVPD